ncbi:hypothetical protein M2138_001054 [Dysgonomonadaceae bacterium PH5-43]|nr:hypothetical protein [Dysgonomonadaceae bacterium PH5-43]
METYTKCLRPVRITTNIFVLLVVSYVFFIACSSDTKIETEERCCDEMINKSLLEHKIKNETLKEFIARYDSLYNEGEKGIVVWCEMSNYTTRYTIGYYDPSTLPTAPMIKCEPINGREIIIVFCDFMSDIELVADKALEFSREAVSEKAYKEFKKIVTANKKSDYEEHIISINDKISLTLNFDKDNNLIRVDTLGLWHNE